MRLDQSIVVVNEYTIKTGEAKGSRGATPGKYVLRYMARDKATQTLAQVRRDRIDSFVTRYMARANAVQELSTTDEIEHAYTPRRRKPAAPAPSSEKDAQRPSVLDDARNQLRLLSEQLRAAQEHLEMMEDDDDDEVEDEAISPVVNKEDVKYRFRQAQLLGGVGFTRGNVSMSHEELQDHAQAMQDHFEAGKTVLKTVVSFDHPYLQEHNIVPPTMPAPPRGGYRGVIDEMKLRYAIMAGVERMGRTHYDDLDYIGVIQVDTAHVHAHLVMVDRGQGTVMKDGTQRGKISRDARAQLRRGADAYLDEHSYVARYADDVAYERQNVVSFIKSWAINTVVRESSAQWIVSHLPNDETKWRAGSRSTSMQRANALVREMVEERLDDPTSPMHSAMRAVERYADKRTQREQLHRDEREALVTRGRTQIVEQAMNGVYGVLAALPRNERQAVTTPLMRVMTMDPDELYEAVQHGRDIIGGVAQPDASRDVAVDARGRSMSLEAFGMRLRTYTSRRDYHLAQREVYETAMRDWEKAYQDGRASAASRVMYEHAEQEAAYHARAGQKYTRIFGDVGNDTAWQQQWERVAALGDECVRLGAMRKDRSLARMGDEDAAEEQGKAIYGVSGAGALTRTGSAGKAARDAFDARLDSLRDDYAHAVDALNRRWSRYGAHIAVASQEDVEADDAVTEGVSVDAHTRMRLRRSMLPPEAGAVALRAADGDSSGDDVTVHTPGAVVECVIAPEFSPAEVQGIDMHDMRNEITDDVVVGPKTRQRYTARTAARRRALDRARAFMVSSGQSAQTVQLDSAERDITRAEETVRVLDATDGVLVSDIAQHVQRLRTQRQARERDAAAALDAAQETAVAEADAEAVVPQRVAAREAYETDSLDGVGYSFALDSRVRARVNTEMDTAARRAAEQYTQERTQRRGPVSPAE